MEFNALVEQQQKSLHYVYAVAYVDHMARGLFAAGMLIAQLQNDYKSAYPVFIESAGNIIQNILHSLYISQQKLAQIRKIFDYQM